MFAAADIEAFRSFNVKCDPEEAVELRERYPEVKPGYHMNKRHWNTVEVEGSLPDELMQTWIRASHHLVWLSLSKKQRDLIPL